MYTVYERRVEQEWKLLAVLSDMNSTVLEKLKREQKACREIFSFTLNQTQALQGEIDKLKLVSSHQVILHFPRFFPSTPIEINLTRPVLHPNVHPETGFVCLWNRFSPGDTVMEAISQLQQVITWKLLNEETDHLMQPEALAWYKDPARGVELPLAYTPISKPADFQQERTYAIRPPNSYRKRLE